MKFQLSDILPIFEAIILLGGFIISIRQLKIMTNEIRRQVDWQRKNATFDYLHTYITEFKDVNEELQHKIHLLQQDGETMNQEAINKKLRDEKTRSALFHLVSYFENLAIGITYDYFDEPITKALLHNVVTSAYKSLKPYLLFRRRETGLAVGSNFEELAKKWSTSTEAVNVND